jgi:hypothetical protein
MSSFHRRFGGEMSSFKRAERGLRRGDGGGQQALRLEAKPLGVSQVLLKGSSYLRWARGGPWGERKVAPRPAAVNATLHRG